MGVSGMKTDWKKRRKAEIDRLLADASIPWESLDGARILITGATGVIGFNLVESLLAYSITRDNPPHVIVHSRNAGAAKRRFASVPGHEFCSYYEGDIRNTLNLDSSIDYIVHAASITDSGSFISKPVDVIETSLCGTRNILEFAKDKRAKGVVFLSTMEIYGLNQSGDKLEEDNFGSFDALSVRNCYPESKRMSENLCCAYFSQHGVPVTIARLAQSFGPGVRRGDQRVFSYFTECVLSNSDIVLRTKGNSKRTYVYTLDAVSAILILMLRGARGEAYNVANEETYCSVLEMAEMVSKVIAQGAITVQMKLEDCPQYLPPHYLNLSSGKLRSLGWMPKYSLEDMYIELLYYFEHIRNNS